jgi:hypothetical protein
VWVISKSEEPISPSAIMCSGSAAETLDLSSQLRFRGFHGSYLTPVGRNSIDLRGASPSTLAG